MFLISYTSLIIICIYLISVISTKYCTLPSEIISRNSNLDALRGILASLVVAHHFYITYSWKNTGLWVKPESELLNNLGAIPVSIFFMITGYLFFNKIISSQNLNFISLYKSRIKRIVPLYYFLTFIVFMITIWNISNSSVNISQILVWLINWLTFRGTDLVNFESTKILAGAQWTLMYEWGFYFLLPAIYLIINHRYFKNNLNLVILIFFIFYFLFFIFYFLFFIFYYFIILLFYYFIFYFVERNKP
jgi:peptidoglycan/LPS O-acetylase OafA/YrhL